MQYEQDKWEPAYIRVGGICSELPRTVWPWEWALVIWNMLGDAVLKAVDRISFFQEHCVIAFSHQHQQFNLKKEKKGGKKKKPCLLIPILLIPKRIYSYSHFTENKVQLPACLVAQLTDIEAGLEYKFSGLSPIQLPARPPGLPLKILSWC